MASPASVRHLLPLLRRNPDYRRLFSATVVSLLGDWFALAAISGFVTESTGRPGSAAAVSAASRGMWGGPSDVLAEHRPPHSG